MMWVALLGFIPHQSEGPKHIIEKPSNIFLELPENVIAVHHQLQHKTKKPHSLDITKLIFPLDVFSTALTSLKSILSSLGM